MSYQRLNHFLKFKFLCLILMSFCFLFLSRALEKEILPDVNAWFYYHVTNCSVLSKRLITHHHGWQRYRADFLLSYNVEDAEYHRWISVNGLDRHYSHAFNFQNNYFAHFQVGQDYICFYNPQDPQSVILLPRSAWLTPIGCAWLIALFFFILIFIKCKNQNV